MAQDLAESSSLGQDSGPSTVREVQVDGNILSSDGKGKIMYDTVNFNQFNDWFEKQRPDNFSYEGRFALFNYLEELENDTGDKIKFDPIALCCEYSEYDNFKKIQENYDDIENLEKLKDHTTVIEIEDSEKLIMQNF